MCVCVYIDRSPGRSGLQSRLVVIGNERLALAIYVYLYIYTYLYLYTYIHIN